VLPRRVKFVFVQYNGMQAGSMARSRAGVHKALVERMVGQFHVFYFADDG
jgi:hypothetical protein